jgi:carbamate kinase
MKPVLLIALGGNALIRSGESGTAEEQFANLRRIAVQMARLARDWRLVITHGNGPQVGNLLLQQECCADVPKLPLELLVAQTQGQIGYMIESTLDEELTRSGVQRHLVSVISYIVVEKDDPAFADPTKPIGPVLSEEEAKAANYPIRLTPKGLRRVIASPRPITVVEREEIRILLENNFIVVCCGGGGIPVIRRGRAFQGVDAIIDKDLASARLAEEIGVELFLIATDVEGAALNFGSPEEIFLRTMRIEEAERFHKEGHFANGSMGPKVEAAVQFVRAGGKRALITSVDAIEAAVAGEAGTRIVP